MESDNIPGGAIILTLANTLQYILMAFFYIILTKTNSLTQMDIGNLSILSFLSSTFSLITMFSLHHALTKFVSEKQGKNQKEESSAIQKTITELIITLSVIGLVVAILLSQLISQQLWNNSEYIVILILNFTYTFLHNMRLLCNSILQAFYLFGKIAAITITFVVLSRVIAISLALFNMGITGVLIGYIIGMIVALTVAIKFLPKKATKTTKKTAIKPILSYSFPLFLSSITIIILQWADIVIISTLTGDLSLTGVYSIVVSSVGTLSLLYVPVNTTILPAISAHHGLQKPESISNILTITSRIIIYVLLPSCLGLATIAPTALAFFYNPSYVKGAIALSILSVTTLIIALKELFSTTLQGIGKTGQILKMNTIAGMSLLITLLILVPFLETTGAALAHLFTQIMFFLLAMSILKNEIKIRFDREGIWKAAVSTTAFIPLLLTIELTLKTKLTTTQTLALEISTAAAIYAFSLYFLKALKHQDFKLLRQAFPKALSRYINKVESIMVR